MKLRPPTPVALIWLTVFYVLIAAACIIAALTWPAGAAPIGIPDGAVPMAFTPLPCDGGMLFYDLNNNPEDGFELVAVVKNDEDQPRVLTFYGAGDEGAFERAVVRIPGKPEEVFTTPEKLTAAYPHPCDILRAPGSLKT